MTQYPNPNKAEGTMEFTREMFLTMSQEEVLAFWRDQQRERRDAGEPHYTTLIDPVTGETVTAIDAETK